MLVLFLLAALQAAPAPPAASLYTVGPNDVLMVTVLNQPQLTGKFTVEADGTFAFPPVGRVAAGGLSVRAIEDKVRERLLAAGYLTDPRVSVVVDQYRSQQIFVMGEVKQPGSLQFTGAMTLIEALARAGSTTERAGTVAVIVRSSSAGSAAPAQNPNAPSNDTISVNLQSLQSGTLSQNLALRAGDTIFVPRAESVFVSGQVRTPGEYVIRSSGMTVRQAIALAGGVTERGSSRRVQIIRVVNGKEVATGVALETAVQAGDTIVVQERFF
jgi:polysaccharide export outer membrane protein